MKRSIKRAWILAMTAVLVICMFAVPVFADYQELLSEMPDEQMMAELEKMGLEIPESFLDDHPEERATLARWLIRKIEENPRWVFAVGRADLYEYYLSIKNAVFKYYGWPEEYYLSKENSDGYQLQNSTYYSTGSASQNCYGYALNRIIYKDPGYYAYNMANISNSQLAGMSVYQLAERAKADLQTTGSNGLNQQCVIITSTRPSYQSGTTAICVRKGKLDTSNYYDYHFMRVFSGSVWRHKPGNTCILTYNSLPSNSVNWTNEYATSSSNFEPSDTTYSGQIYYIKYAASHSYSNEYTGENYHSGSKHYYRFADTCSRCGYTTNYTWQSIPCSWPPCPDYHPNKIIEASTE